MPKNLQTELKHVTSCFDEHNLGALEGYRKCFIAKLHYYIEKTLVITCMCKSLTVNM